MLVALWEDLVTTKELEACIENPIDVAARDAQAFNFAPPSTRANGLERERAFLFKGTFSRSGTEECNVDYFVISRAKQELVPVVKVTPSIPFTRPDDRGEELF